MIRICEAAPSIHHLLFADDSFLFGKANLEECAEAQHILVVFSQSVRVGNKLGEK